MTNDQQLSAVAYETRGQSELKYAEPVASGPRALYGITGLLIGSIGGFLKRLTSQSSAPLPDIESPERDATDQGRFAVRRQADDAASSDAGINGAAEGASSRPALSHHRVSGHGQALSFEDQALGNVRGALMMPAVSSPVPDNDNAALQFPMPPPSVQTATAGGGGSGAAARGDQRSDSENDDTATSSDDVDGTGDDTGSDGTQRNRAPVVNGPVNLGTHYINTSIVIGLVELLRNTSDPDGDQLFVENFAVESGNLVSDGGGSWIFTPEVDDDGDITLTYLISDGTESIAQTASIDLVHAPITWAFGSDGDDVMIGTDGDDHIASGGGSDIVQARGGDDDVDGGNGDDVIAGGPGDDLIHGGFGDDVIDAGAGNDIVFGGSGDDLIIGGDGDDVLSGDEGDDQIVGNAGDDVGNGGTGNDTFFAIAETVAESSQAAAQAAPSVPLQPPAVPLATTATHSVSLDSKVRSDGNDIYDGGEGVDTYDMSATSADIAMDLGAGTASSEDIGTDIVANIENVATGRGDDIIIGDAASNVVTAGGGSDIVATAEGNDTIVAAIGDGDDIYDGGEGIDTYDMSATSADIVVDLGAGTASGADIGTDVIANIENVVAGAGKDVIIASDERNKLAGGDGDDTFVFTSVGGSLPTIDRLDTIEDFEVGDKIDLSRIDGDENSDGQQKFEFKYDSDKFEKAGEVRYKVEKRDDGDYTVVMANTDDDLEEDFAIDVHGAYEFGTDDFIGLS